MGRVLTNDTALSYSRETALGEAGSDWNELEYNTIGSFGANIATTARNPVGKKRQRRKGTITDRDSGLDFETDVTLSAFRDFIEGFVFANAVNGDVTELEPSAVVAGGYTISARPAGSTPLKSGHLIYASGFDGANNNGLRALTGALAATGISVPVSGSTAEASPPDDAVISLAGYRASGVGNASWSYDNTTKRATLSHTDIGDGTLMTEGQFVHIGSIDSSGDIQNAFQRAAADDMFGYARVYSIADDEVVFDKLSDDLQQTSAMGGTIDILFGEFIRNVATDHDDYLSQSFAFEATYPGLGPSANPTEYEYAVGNYCNTLGFSVPLTDKATMSIAFVGTDTEDIVNAQKTGADDPQAPRDTTAYNTSADVARLRFLNIDEDGITTDFKNLTITLGNNVTPEKVVGTVGAKYINFGNFNVDIEAQMLFTSKDVTNAIRKNETASMDFVLNNDNGAIIVDVPSLTIGGGGKEYPVGESVLINTASQAFEDDNLGTSIGVSIIPVPGI